jgi:hypothetical protein
LYYMMSAAGWTEGSWQVLCCWLLWLRLRLLPAAFLWICIRQRTCSCQFPLCGAGSGKLLEFMCLGQYIVWCRGVATSIHVLWNICSWRVHAHSLYNEIRRVLQQVAAGAIQKPRNVSALTGASIKFVAFCLLLIMFEVAQGSTATLCCSKNICWRRTRCSRRV